MIKVVTSRRNTSAVRRPVKKAERAVGILFILSTPPRWSSLARPMAVLNDANPAVWAMIPGINQLT